MPLAVVRSKHCNDYAFHPANIAVLKFEAWVPDIASQFRNDESFGDRLAFHPAKSGVRTIEAWVPDIASAFAKAPARQVAIPE